MPVCLCLCTFIEIRNGTKNLDFVLCTVVYIDLGKTSVTIWTIGSLENWGNHWVKWTILRSFRATWVTLPDCIGGVTWQHIKCHLWQILCLISNLNLNCVQAHHSLLKLFFGVSAAVISKSENIKNKRGCLYWSICSQIRIPLIPTYLREIGLGCFRMAIVQCTGAIGSSCRSGKSLKRR